MSTITTDNGVTWNITTINDRVAFQAGDFLVLWLPHIWNYALIDGMANVCMTGLPSECMSCVSDVSYVSNVREVA